MKKKYIFFVLLEISAYLAFGWTGVFWITLLGAIFIGEI